MAPPREDKITWVDSDMASSSASTGRTAAGTKQYGSFPATHDATTSSRSRQATERGPLLPSHQETGAVHYPHWPSSATRQGQQRRLRWLAIAVSVSSILGVACLLLEAVARSGTGSGSGSGSPTDAPSVGSEVTAAVAGAGGEAALPLPLPGDSFLESEGEGSVFAALRLGFPGATMAREGAAPAAADPSPDYPSSAPQGGFYTWLWIGGVSAKL